MTTPMSKTLGKPIKSRVHIPLHFPDLSLLQQRLAWQNLIGSVNFAEASREALKHFVNGSLSEGAKSAQGKAR